MLCPYLRSSLIGSWKTCEMQSILTYSFGFTSRAGAKASGGTCVHRMFELRALASIAKKAGQKKFHYECFGTVKVDWAMDYDKMIDKVYAYQQEMDTHVDWSKMPKKTVLEWAKKTITDYPEYDPVNLNILSVEKFFDFEINKPWAKYKTTLNGKPYEGTLALRGTIDCIIDHGDNIIECFDLKTGRRADFATGAIKDNDYLKTDHQLLFYLYALKHIYPDKNIIMSLYFINDGGIFSVVGDDEMLKKAEELIKKTFKEIVNCKFPKLLDPKREDWRCKYCCEYSKPADFTNGKSVCEFIHEKIKQKGLKSTIEEHANLERTLKYHEGGGKKK